MQPIKFTGWDSQREITFYRFFDVGERAELEFASFTIPAVKILHIVSEDFP